MTTRTAPHPRRIELQPKYAWVVMSILWGMDIINMLVFFSLGLLVPVWTEDLGVTPIEAGLLGSVGFLGFGLMALPAAIWITKYNPRLVALLSSIGMTIAVLLHAIATSVEILLLARFGFVVMTVIRIQVQVIFIQQWFKPSLYPLVNSLDFSFRSVGQVIALAATSFLIAVLGGWRALFIAIGVAAASLTILWGFYGREPNNHRENTSNSNLENNPAGVLRREKIIWITSSSQMGAATAFASFINFYPTFAIERSGISLEAIGLIMSLYPIGGIIGSITAGPLSQAIGRRKPFIWIGGIALPILYTAMLWVDSGLVLATLMFCAGVFSMVVPPTLTNIAFDLELPPRELSVALALMRTLFPVGATIGPVFVGILAEVTGSLFLGLSIVAPLAATLFIAGIFLPETGPKGSYLPATK